MGPVEARTSATPSIPVVVAVSRRRSLARSTTRRARGASSFKDDATSVMPRARPPCHVSHWWRLARVFKDATSVITCMITEIVRITLMASCRK